MTTTISPALGHGVLDTQAGVGTSPGYDAIDRRRAFHGFQRGEGVWTYNSFLVSQRGAGANMSVDIGMDDCALVRGDAITLQGLYTVAPHSATINETISAADATNPRIDRVILELQDNTHDASGQNRAQTRVVAGTPTGGATLDNLTGAAAVPSSAMLLADVLVGASVSSITNANIRDRRPFQTGVAPLLTDVDMVAFEPPSFIGIGQAGLAQGGGGVAACSNQQAAVLMRLPRRIASATRIRWRYQQGAAAGVTGNYVLAIFDASGRKIIDTGAVALTGAAASVQARSETITATTFEAGLYYVFVGFASLSIGAGTTPVLIFNGVNLGSGNSPAMSALPGTPNSVVFASSGGTTVPTTILGLTDQVNQVIPSGMGVPQVALSVG